MMVLDLPVEMGLERKGGAGSGDRIEREGETFLNRVREGYRRLAADDPVARLLEAEGTPEELQRTLRRVLGETFPGTFPSEVVE